MTRRGSAPVADGAVRALEYVNARDAGGTPIAADEVVAALEQMLALGWRGGSADGR